MLLFSLTANLILYDQHAQPETYSLFFGDGEHTSGFSLHETTQIRTTEDYTNLVFDTTSTDGIDRVFLERSGLKVHKVLQPLPYRSVCIFNV